MGTSGNINNTDPNNPCQPYCSHGCSTPPFPMASPVQIQRSKHASRKKRSCGVPQEDTLFNQPAETTRANPTTLWPRQRATTSSRRWEKSGPIDQIGQTRADQIAEDWSGAAAGWRGGTGCEGGGRRAQLIRAEAKRAYNSRW